MGRPLEVFNPAEWGRRGRGRELQFFATDDEVLRYFEQLPLEFGPYSVVGTRLVGRAGCYEPVSFAYALDGYLEALAQGGRDTPQLFWLRSAALTPATPDGLQGEPWWSMNGYLVVQHGAMRKGRRLESRIAIVSKLENLATGEVRHLKRAGKMFEFLRTLIRKDLRYATLQVFRDGHEEEDSGLQMTEAAARLARKGFFVRMPGRPTR